MPNLLGTKIMPETKSFDFLDLIGSKLHSININSTFGRSLNLTDQQGKSVVFFYPLTGRDGW
jgi:hypothetical protein